MRRLIGVLVLLFLVAVAGDRLAAGYAAAQAEQQLVGYGFRSPTVTIRGFPFVTQLMDRQYRHVDVTAAKLKTAAGTAELLTATLRGVRIDSITKPREVVVRALSARGTLPYAEIEKAADVPTLTVTKAREGDVRLKGTVTLLGEKFTVAARGRITARGDHIRVTPTAVEVEGIGQLDERLSSLLKDRFAVDYAIPSLPAGVSVRSIEPTTKGLRVHITGRDTQLQAP